MWISSSGGPEVILEHLFTIQGLQVYSVLGEGRLASGQDPPRLGGAEHGANWRRSL